MKHIYFYLICLLQLAYLASYGQPRVLFPQNGQVLTSNQVIIQWKDTASAFDLQWANNPSLTGAITITNINAKSYQLSSLPFNNNYYFRVKRSGGNWSSIFNFFILDLSSLTSLQYWWDAGWGITSNGNKITSWQDRIGLVQAQNSSSTSQPEITSTFPNGLPLIRFGGPDGTANQTLILSTPINLLANNFTIITKLRVLSTGLIDYLLGGTQQGLFVGGSLGGYNNLGIFNNPNDLRINENPTYLHHAVYAVYRNKIYRDNLLKPINGTSVSTFQIDQIGTRPDLINFSFHGYVGDIMIFNTELNDSIRLIVENYQKWKWLQYPNLGNDTTVCASEFTLSVPQPNVYSSILWSNGATDVPSITINQSGTYWVQVSAMGITLTDTIHIQGLQPQKDITPNDTTICAGQPLTLKVINPTPTHQYIWSNGVIQDSIIITQPGNYYCLEYIPSLNCYIPTDTIHVTKVLHANFQVLGNCENQPLSFFDNSFSSTNYVQSWNWDFGDPSTSTDTAVTFFANYSYSTFGSYNVQLIVTDTNGCADTAFQVVNIFPNPIANFSVNKECLNDPIQFTNLSTIQAPYSISGYKWYFGTIANDSSSLINPKFTYTHQGDYVITLITTSSNGCKHTKTDTLQINKFVDAAFILPEDTLCKGSTYPFTDNSTYFNTQPAQWQWSISGVNVGNQNPQNLTFQQSGMQQVRLIVTSADNCTDSAKYNVFIKIPPTASFTATPQVSAPPLVSLFNYTGTPSVSQIIWDFGDGNSNIGNPVTHTYNDIGLYTATLIAIDNNGCSDTTTRTMNVVVPVFDLMLSGLICTEINGYIQFSAEIQNLSTVTITNMEVEAWVQGAQPALENWQGELFIGNTLNYETPYSLLAPPGAMYCCLRIGEVTGVISDSVFNKTLCVPLKNEFTVFTPFPNPTDGAFQMHLIIPITDEAVIVISDLQGKVLYEQTTQLSSGLHTLSFNGEFLSSGVYTVTVYYRGERKVVRLLKR